MNGTASPRKAYMYFLKVPMLLFNVCVGISALSQNCLQAEAQNSGQALWV